MMCTIDAKLKAVEDGLLNKFDVVDQLFSDQSEEFINSVIHEDFFLLREEGLVTRDEFIEYVTSHDEVGNDNHIEMLELKCLFEDENSLIWQDKFRSIAFNTIFTTITYVTYKDGKWWRAMMNKFELKSQ